EYKKASSYLRPYVNRYVCRFNEYWSKYNSLGTLFTNRWCPNYITNIFLFFSGSSSWKPSWSNCNDCISFHWTSRCTSIRGIYRGLKYSSESYFWIYYLLYFYRLCNRENN